MILLTLCQALAMQKLFSQLLLTLELCPARSAAQRILGDMKVRKLPYACSVHQHDRAGILSGVSLRVLHRFSGFLENVVLARPRRAPYAVRQRAHDLLRNRCLDFQGARSTSGSGHGSIAAHDGMAHGYVPVPDINA